MLKFAYDANGNLLRKQNTANAAEHTRYTWDASNRLVRLERFAGDGSAAAASATLQLSASFTYDAFGRRIQSTVTQGGSTSTVQYLYEGAQSLGEIRDSKLSHRLLSGLNLDESIARIALTPNGSPDPATSRTFITDALNSVIAQFNTTDSSLANSYAYSPYGQGSTIGPDPTTNPIQYTSRENDQASAFTGLYFYRARYYDPVLKRFISSDPIGLDGGMNVYEYVAGDPISLFDPLGLYTEIIRWAPSPGFSGSWGHISGNINGKNFSFGPKGWDMTYLTAQQYADRQRAPDINREGAGIILQLTPDQETKLARCLGSFSRYNAFSNNCGNPWLRCLENLQVVHPGNRPQELPEDVMKIIGASPRASGSTSYPGKVVLHGYPK